MEHKIRKEDIELDPENIYTLANCYGIHKNKSFKVITNLITKKVVFKITARENETLTTENIDEAIEKYNSIKGE